MGPGRGRLPGRQLPRVWTEWNGKYRDAVRRFWRGDDGGVSRAGDAAHRHQRPVRAERPPAVRQHQLRHRHDGFTLADLVSYNEKHNEANGEDNRDGENDNLQLELRRRRPDRRPAHPRRCARGSGATSWPR